MPGPRKRWLSLDANSVAGCQDAAGPMSARVNFGLGRACIVAENEGVHIHRPGLAVSPIATQNLRTETRAHFRDPKSGAQRCLKS